MSHLHFDSDLSAAVQRMTAVAADERVTLDIQNVLLRPGTQLLAYDGDDILFKLQSEMREDLPHYRFFVLRRLIEVRRMGLFSDKYSFIDFPKELVADRNWVEQRFAAISVRTADGLGWLDGRWEDFDDAQRVICTPKFVEDNVRSLS